ncbi:hypothetical protein CCYS_11825 [Corynebacterium cystitidis DSM 20524]|uniref:Uncharacterized protein n=1 Tax=Corynebacterium cystitidis DSM 20524 TaxID=1121357 RepID=A0A1H9W9G9_9CORY|nr:hypothetical protein CCYS_11825 [Corynebacterium cystitidis DSM 20524]SES30464.1 hypothetical protein SAMN05661109_02613 [Corynebacterium cystitidis DSM 20524]SNV64267.1 Uncharacterised protein [Corynebacterium cystitidis]
MVPPNLKTMMAKTTSTSTKQTQATTISHVSYAAVKLVGNMC